MAGLQFPTPSPALAGLEYFSLDSGNVVLSHRRLISPAALHESHRDDAYTGSRGRRRARYVAAVVYNRAYFTPININISIGIYCCRKLIHPMLFAGVLHDCVAAQRTGYRLPSSRWQA